MAIVTTTPEVPVALSTVTVSNTFTWLTGWMPAIAMDQAIAILKLRNMSGTIRVQPCYQLADTRTDKPSAPVLVGQTLYATDDEYCVPASDYAIGGVTPGVTYIRFGLASKLNTAPNTGTADATFQISTLSLGMLLPPWMGHPVATDATKMFVPITGWLSVLSVLTFEATVVIADLLGGFGMKLTYRTADASPEDPDAWNTTGLGSLLDSNGESSSTELSPTTTAKALIQLGFYCQSTSGIGQADVSVLLGIRQAS